MSEVHVPPVHGKSFGALLLEVGMISIAVFLGLLADQWRENRHYRELARTALENFRSEVLTNQAAIAQRSPYHVAVLRKLLAFENSAGSKDKAAFDTAVHFTGTHPVVFEHTAWDLALATQALAYIDPALAFRVSRVYTTQTALQTHQFGFLQVISAPGTFAGPDFLPATIALRNYFEDIVIMEPELMKQYEQLVPELNLVLGNVGS